MIAHGVSQSKVFVLNNTIDIEANRLYFEKWLPHRDRIRRELNLGDKPTFLFVGRLIARKKLDLLLEAMELLEQQEWNCHLLAVGSGQPPEQHPGNVSFLGSVMDNDEMAKIYVASDLFAHPGAVGLAPLQALCYDLPTVYIDSDVHKPEEAYLNESNSVKLDKHSTAADYASAIKSITLTQDTTRLKRQCWPSICHLTIDAMAQRFIAGVNHILYPGE